jgi:hypothetical protein
MLNCVLKDNTVVNANPALKKPRKKIFLISSAWLSILLISDLPNILWNSFSGQVPEWLIWIKVGLLGLFVGFCLIRKSIRPLLHYAFVFLVFYLSLGGKELLGETPWWQSRFGGSQVSFTLGYLGIYILDLGVAFAVIAALWIVKRNRNKFFLAKGQLDAPIEPVRWLGIRKGESWRTFGWIFSVVVCLGILIPTALSLRPSSDTL